MLEYYVVFGQDKRIGHNNLVVFECCIITGNFPKLLQISTSEETEKKSLF